MERLSAYIYNLTEDKAHIRLTVGNVTPTIPTLPLKEQKVVKITGGYKIENWRKVSMKLTWYHTDRTLILPDRDDQEAFYYFRAILNERSKKIIDELYVSERIIDEFCESFRNGKLILEK